MSGDRFEIGLFSRVERSAVVPGIVNGRHDPEVAFSVPHHPLLGRLIHKNSHHVLLYSGHILLLTRTGADESTMLPLLMQSAVASQSQKTFARWTSAVPLPTFAHCFGVLRAAWSFASSSCDSDVLRTFPPVPCISSST